MIHLQDQSPKIPFTIVLNLDKLSLRKFFLNFTRSRFHKMEDATEVKKMHQNGGALKFVLSKVIKHFFETKKKN